MGLAQTHQQQLPGGSPHCGGNPRPAQFLKQVQICVGTCQKFPKPLQTVALRVYNVKVVLIKQPSHLAEARTQNEAKTQFNTTESTDASIVSQCDIPLRTSTSTPCTHTPPHPALTPCTHIPPHPTLNTCMPTLCVMVNTCVVCRCCESACFTPLDLEVGRTPFFPPLPFACVCAFDLGSPGCRLASAALVLEVRGLTFSTKWLLTSKSTERCWDTQKGMRLGGVVLVGHTHTHTHTHTHIHTHTHTHHTPAQPIYLV